MKILIYIFFCSSLAAQGFYLGEKYDYDVFYGFIRVGHASIETSPNLETVNGKQTYHVTYKFKTTKVGDRIYKVRDKLELWLEIKDFQLVQQKKTLREKGWEHDSLIIMDGNKAIIKGVQEGKIIDKIKESPDYFFNPYAMILILRDFKIMEGESMEFLTFERRPKSINITNIGKKSIKTKAGNFEGYIYKPYNKGKPALKNSGDLELAYSYVNETIIPADIVLKLNKGYGSIHLKLQKYETGKK